MLNINEINNMLEQGKSVKDIRLSLSIGEKSFQKQIKELGYKYNQKIKQYEKIEAKLTNLKDKNYYSNTGVINQTDVLADIDIKKVVDLVKHYDMIKELLKWFKNKEYENSIIEVIQDNRIEIDLETEETKRTTILINKKIYDDFNVFCQRHKEYDKKDLLSMALKEYIQKHN
jgi:fructose-1-phosphate kinase PfkB-like protein